MKRISSCLSILALSTSILGCVDSSAGSEESDDLTGSGSGSSGQACPVSGTDITKSLAITDAASLKIIQKKFTFTRTLDQILATSGADASETGAQLFDQWFSTFGSADCTNPKVDPNHYGEVCPRLPEDKLASVDPTDPKSKVKFTPVGLFNRFDLAPKNGATCGEYRIVYAMSSTDPNIGGRGFIIFEAALPNPQPALKAKGCLAVAEWWQNLTNDPDATDRVNQLEKLYYLGTAIPGVGPVVDAHNYGMATNGGAYGFGQMRTNMFIDGAQWHLREFKTDLTCVDAGTSPADESCTLAADHVTVKTNPANEVFDGTAKRAPAFAIAFPKQVPALSSTDVSTIGMTIGDQYNEYESVSEFKTDVEYDKFTDAGLTADIQTALGSGNVLTTTDILRRATTQTCAGCHQLSTFAPENDLGGLLKWPASLGFVQINEQSQLSPALLNNFLPHRKTVLEAYINQLCGGGALVDDGLTVGGSQVGAAN